MSTLKTGALRGTSGTADSIQLHASNQSVTFPGDVTCSGTATGFGAAPGWNKIATNTYSDVATIDIEDTAAFDGTYDFVKIYMSNVRPASDNQMLLWRIKQGGSYATTDYYSHSLVWYNSTNTITNERTGDDPRGEWTTGTVGNAAAECLHAHWEFATPTNTAYYPTFNWEGWGWQAGDTSMKISGSGGRKVLGAFTGLRLYAVSGNLSAKVTTYGLTT